MSDLTRSEKLLAEKTVCILLVRGQNAEDMPIYAYVAVRADKLEEFMEAQKNEAFYPEEYGMILEQGEGEPSEEVIARMRDEYGFNHDAMVNIENPVHATQLQSDIVKQDPKHPNNLHNQ